MNDWGAALFDPARVAVIGASNAPGKLGALFMRNLLDGFGGEVIPIHPQEAAIGDRPAYPTVRAVPGTVDLAVIVAPPAAVLGAVEDCAAAGVRVAVIVTGGFAEIGAPGRERQARIAAAARAGGLRLVGPNCFGIINVHAGLNASLGMGLPERGGVSLFTQSGAYGMAAFSRSREGGIGFAKVLAPGNTIDLDATDALAYLGTDPHTRVIALLLESIRDGAAFVAALRAVTPHKPVVILKTGRRGAAQRAAASHTDALAGDYRIAAAALRQAGARLVEDGLSLLDVASALDLQPAPRGARVAIVTNSGGTGVELTDLLEDHGLEVPALSAPVQAQIAAALPAYGSAVNPVDVTTDWPRFAEMYGTALRALAASGEVDVVVPVLLQRSALLPEVTQRVIAEAGAARAHGVGVHVCWVGPAGSEENRRALLAAGIPCHAWAARTAQTIAACCARPVSPEVPTGPALPRPDGADPDGWLDARSAYALLAQAGIPHAPFALAADADAAVRAVAPLSPPLVLKAIRPELVHKSEARAVRMHVVGEAQIRATVADFERRLGRGPTLVQEQAAPGVELVVGALRDPQFGPLVLVGLGGVWVEVLDDVALRVAPFGEDEAHAMLAELRAQPLLDGARGSPPVDRAALARLIARTSEFVARAPWLSSLDVNPLVVVGATCTAVDVRAQVVAAPPVTLREEHEPAECDAPDALVKGTAR